MTPWAYLDREAAHDAPESDNPSALYCPACRAAGLSHCAHPEFCGGMRRMRARSMDEKREEEGKAGG